MKLEHGGPTYRVASVSDGPKLSDDLPIATDPSAPVTCWHTCMPSTFYTHRLGLGLALVVCVCGFRWTASCGETWLQGSHLDPFVVWSCTDVWMLTYTPDVTVMLGLSSEPTLMTQRWNMADLIGFDPVLLDRQSGLSANLRRTVNSQALFAKNTHYLVIQPLGLDVEPSLQKLNLILGSDVSAAPSVCLWGRVCISPGSASVQGCGFQAISVIALMLFI